MKKNFFRIMAIALAAMLVITGCAQDNPNTVSTKTITVKGSAIVKSAGTRAVEAGNTAEFASGKFVVNGENVAGKLTPTVEGQKLVDAAPVGTKVNNVEFEVTVEASKTTKLEAAPEFGYIFDEWDIKKDCPADLEDEIEDYLESKNLEKNPVIEIPTEYVEWLAPEYDNGYYVTFVAKEEGDKITRTLEELEAILTNTEKKFEEDELTLIIKGDATEENIKALNAVIEKAACIEELKIISNGTELTTEVMDVTFEEIEYKGFKFTKDLTINFKAKAAVPADDDEEDAPEYEVEFKNCSFQNVTVNVEKDIVAEEIEIEFKNCTMKNLTLNNESAIEVEGELDGKASSYETLTQTGTWNFDIDEDVKKVEPAPAETTK